MVVSRNGSRTRARRRGAEVRADAERAEQSARRAEKRTWFRRLARAGLAARGIVYLLLALLAFEIAITRSSSAQVDSRGAFAEIDRQPGGPALLAVLAAGLLAYATWRLVQTAAGQPDEGRSEVMVRIGWFASGALYLVLCAEAMALVVGGAQVGGGITSNPRPAVATVLRWPIGAGVIGLAGAVVAGSGIALLVWGIVHDYAKVLERLSRRGVTVASVVGAIGDAARGLVIALVAAFLFWSAVAENADDARGLGSALESLVRVPVGRELVGVLAGGLLAYGVYSLIEARWRRI